MANSPESKGNPEIGMTEDSFESAENSNAGSEAFFDNLDSAVNGGIQDQDTQVTQTQPEGTVQATPQQNDSGPETPTQVDNGQNWEKRYADSSREAVRWRDRYKEVEQFVPVLEAMKEDSGLVDHVRDYLVNGGTPAKTIQEELSLPEDFEFDQQEAMSNPDSNSAKLMNAHVDKLVQQRVGEMHKVEKERANQINQQRARKSEEIEFMKRNKMSPGDFDSFKAQAQKHQLTLDDVHYLVNRDKAASNVAENTRNDMLNQMKNVRSMPTSASSSNSQGGKDGSPDRDVFNSILGFDDSVDNMFG